MRNCARVVTTRPAPAALIAPLEKKRQSVGSNEQSDPLKLEKRASKNELDSENSMKLRIFAHFFVATIAINTQLHTKAKMVSENWNAVAT